MLVLHPSNRLTEGWSAVGQRRWRAWEKNEKQSTSRNYCIRSFHPVHLLLTYSLTYSTITSQLYHMLTYVNTHTDMFSSFYEILLRTHRFHSIYRGKSLLIQFVTHFKMLRLVNKLKLGRIATIVWGILIKLHVERG